MFVAPRWLWPVAPLLVLAQQPGSLTPEKGPTISVKECSKAGCTQKDLHVTMDANWRWIHTEEGYQNCYSGDSWDTTVCTDPGVCAKSCAVEGLDTSKYETTYGVTQIDGGVKLGFVTGSNVGSRLYLLEDENYKMFKLKNREFAVDVDASQVQCGMNGAMYFVEMDAAGGKGLGSNKAGAMYGTGYCDAQCPRDVKFMSGQANLDRSHGSCCAEMDIWEANNKATSYTAHPCKIDTAGPYICEGVDCADSGSGNELKGLCDKAGCDINPFRDGDTDFWGEGEGFVLDSSKKVTVVTQFITDDGTDAGDLVDIRRFYVQDGKVIESPSINIAPGSPASMTDQMCDEVKKVFENPNDFKAKGGLKAMGESLGRGHVATFSLWDDVSVRMMWLDSCFPTDLDCSAPGVHRGPCGGGDQSAPDFVRSHYGTGWVSYANVAFGEIGTTQQQYPGSPPAPAPTPQPQPPAPTPPPAPTHTPAPTPSPTPTPAPKPAPTPAPRPAPTPSTSCASEWQQCGGKDFQGPTCCSDGFACIISSEYYSQCRPTDHSKNAGPVANKHTDHWKSVGQKSHKQKFLGVVDISLDDDGSLLQLPETCASE